MEKKEDSKRVKILGVVCSPRANGNTHILVEEALKSATESGAEVEIYSTIGKIITPCDGCDVCRQTNKCHIEDDMQELYGKFLKANGIILGSPVYFWSVTAQAKAVIDRTYVFKIGSSTGSCQRIKRELGNKVGAAFVVARKRGVAYALATINNFFYLHDMVIAGGVACFGDERGDVRNNERAIKEAWRVGKLMVDLIDNKYR